MSADTSIYNKIKTAYNSTTYFNRFPQSLSFNTQTPQILVKNISQVKTDDKDKEGRYEATYRVEVAGGNYINCKSTAAAITALLETHSDSDVYLVSYDGEFYDTNDTADIHRVIVDYRIFINI